MSGKDNQPKTISPEDLKAEEYKRIALEEITEKSGVYIFLLKKDYKYKKSVFEKEVTGKFVECDENGNVVCEGKPYLLCVPEFNLSNGNVKQEFTLQKHKMLYVGSAKNLKNRIREHWKSNKINRTSSLKLGFNTRKQIKDCIDIYVKEIAEYAKCKKKEKALRNDYGTYFGR